jgi:hypothetical protein
MLQKFVKNECRNVYVDPGDKKNSADGNMGTL